jgi:MYXO-CTERM domain-containing protein
VVSTGDGAVVDEAGPEGDAGSSNGGGSGGGCALSPTGASAGMAPGGLVLFGLALVARRRRSVRSPAST